MRFESRWTQATVRRTEDVASNVRLIEIEPETGAERFSVGSHLNVRVIVGDAQAERSYSLVGAEPVDGAYRIAVQQREDSRGGSRYMWTLQPGARLAVSDPQNLFELRHGRPQYLLIAGGIGITPILGMAETLDRRGADLRMLYAGRSRDRMPFLDQLRDRLGDRLEVFVSEEGDRIDLDAEVAALDAGAELYLCGPQRLLEGARRAWDAAGRPAPDLRYETFGSSGRFPAEEFEVELADRDVRLTVGVNQTMLEALEAAGVPSMYDCRRGECGLCALKVLEVDGELDHRDVFLSEEEKTQGDRLCTCVSRIAGNRVTLDTGYRP